ncbi:hypothetical protein [Entomospira culicis]|uniref:Uncharacterized protein n=1 Tax=Entomospira culicis TaxID=2719989 RepID=A0A968GG92_9SPIO|nr:hypothetical protein [Entomospira culicis]NIZ19348.1 hypothetical protein [Entomospira culicis]NIZ69747.1 hypothetical protein [Entomospira culicis]WDI36858.1 hypothetical protein PVA46_05905 [Entomospira culicis]WDI38487.1 hypothetical protein PVA47_05915 [Entomospira culicis]
MAKMINLEKKGPVTVYANGLMLHLDFEDDNKLIATIESEEGGQPIDIHPHPELANTVVFEIKESDPPPKSKFRLI